MSDGIEVGIVGDAGTVAIGVGAVGDGTRVEALGRSSAAFCVDCGVYTVNVLGVAVSTIVTDLEGTFETYTT